MLKILEVLMFLTLSGPPQPGEAEYTGPAPWKSPYFDPELQLEL